MAECLICGEQTEGENEFCKDCSAILDTYKRPSEKAEEEFKPSVKEEPAISVSPPPEPTKKLRKEEKEVMIEAKPPPPPPPKVPSKAPPKKTPTIKLEAIEDEVEKLNIPLIIKRDEGVELSDRDRRMLTAIKSAIDEKERRTKKPLENPTIYIKIGNAELICGNFENALLYFDKVISLNANLSDAWYAKGMVLDKLGRYKEAIRCYERATKIDPTLEDAWYNRAIAFDDLGRYTEAIKCYEEILALNPDNSDAWYRKGKTLENLGRIGDANACFEKAAKLAPAKYGVVEEKPEIVPPEAPPPPPSPPKPPVEELPQYQLVMNSIQLAEKLIAELKELNVDTAKLEDILARARSAMAAESYDDALDYANECVDDADMLKREARRAAPQPPAPLTPPSPPKIIRDEAAERAARDEAFREIRNAQAVIKDAKGYVNTPEAEKLIDQAIAAMNNRDYEHAVGYAKEATKSAKELKHKYMRATNTLQAAWVKIKSLREAGKDVTEAQDLITKARTAMKNKSYDEGYEYAKKAEVMVLSPKERLEHRAVEAIRDIESAIADAKADGAVTGARHLLLREAESFLVHAKSAMDEGNHEEAVRFTEKANRTLKELKQHQLSKEATDLIGLAQSLINDAKEKNIDIAQAEVYMTRAETKFEDEKYEEAIEYAARAEKLAKESIFEAMRTSAEATIESADEIILDAKKLGASTPDADELLAMARARYDAQEFEAAITHAKDAFDSAKHAREQFFVRGASIIFSALQRTIDKYKESGVNVSYAEKLFADAKSAFEAGKYEDALKFAKAARKSARDAKLDVLGKSAAEAVEHAGKYLEDAKRWGVPVDEVEAEYLDAKRTLESEDFERAEALAETTLTKLKELANKHVGKKLQDAMIAVEVTTEELKPLNIDTSVIDILYNDAKTKFNAGDYDGALASMKTLDDNIKRLERESIGERATAAVLSAQQAIADARELQTDVSDAERLLVQAGNALKAKNYDDALEFAKECKLALQSARTYREVINALKKSRNKINEMKKIGADVTKAEQILAQAKPALLAKRYDEAMKYAKESLAEAEKCELYKLAIDQVEVAWSKISEVKKLGAQVKVADELLADARNAIKAGEYDKALEQVKRCIENAEHIKQKYQEVVDLVQLAQSKIEETREMGADATVAQEFYDHMTKTIDIGDYEKACEYGKRCIEEALTLQLEQISGIKITGVDDSMAGTDADIDNPTLIRCDLCGADIPDDSVYCSLCGGKINK